MALSYLVGKRNGHTTVWTPERVELLIALWREGHTAVVISKRLGEPGITRHGVICKAWRLELPKRVCGRRPKVSVLRGGP